MYIIYIHTYIYIYIYSLRPPTSAAPPVASLRKTAAAEATVENGAGRFLEATELRHSYPGPCPKQSAEESFGANGYSTKFVELVLAGVWV